jgi:hypothetical protein
MKKLRRRLHKAARRSVIERDCISYATILHPTIHPRPMTPIPTIPNHTSYPNITIIHPHPRLMKDFMYTHHHVRED